MPLEMLFSSHDVKRKVSQGYGCSAVAGRLGRVPVPVEFSRRLIPGECPPER